MQFVQIHKLGHSVAELGLESRCIDSDPCSCPEAGSGDGNVDVGASMETKCEASMVAGWYRGRAEWNPVGFLACWN